MTKLPEEMKAKLDASFQALTLEVKLPTGQCKLVQSSDSVIAEATSMIDGAMGEEFGLRAETLCRLKRRLESFNMQTRRWSAKGDAK